MACNGSKNTKRFERHSAQVKKTYVVHQMIEWKLSSKKTRTAIIEMNILKNQKDKEKGKNELQQNERSHTGWANLVLDSSDHTATED